MGCSGYKTRAFRIGSFRDGLFAGGLVRGEVESRQGSQGDAAHDRAERIVWLVPRLAVDFLVWLVACVPVWGSTRHRPLRE